MKKLSLLSLALLFSLSVFSQNFLSTDKQWNVRIEAFGVGGMQIATEIFFIDGDSTVNNLDYKQIWLSADSLSSATFKGLLREVSEKVYYLPVYGEEGLLYDFGLNVGDTAYVISLPNVGNSEFEIFITAIDTIENEGVQRKRIQFTSELSSNYEAWIEGIGSINGPLHTLVNDSWVCPFWLLTCVHDDEELIYKEPYTETCYETSVGIHELSQNSKLSLSQNPVKQGQSIDIEANSSIGIIHIYHISGKLIQTIPSSFTKKQSIKTNDLEKGLYLLKIEMEDGQVLISKVLVI